MINTTADEHIHIIFLVMELYRLNKKWLFVVVPHTLFCITSQLFLMTSSLWYYFHTFCRITLYFWYYFLTYPVLFTAWWCYSYTGWVKRVILTFCRITSPFFVWHHPCSYYITLFPYYLIPLILFSHFFRITSFFWYYFHTFRRSTSPFWYHFHTFSRVTSPFCYYEICNEFC